MKKLELKNNEIDDVIIRKEGVNTMKQNLRWMAMAKVHTVSTLNLNSIYNKRNLL